MTQKNPHKSKILREMWKRCHTDKLNTITAIVGGVGRGKSIAAVRISSEISNWNPQSYEEAMKIIKRHVVFSAKEFLERITDPEMKFGDSIILDEAGTTESMSHLRFMTKIHQMVNQVLQTFRHRRFYVFYTMPNLKFVDKSARRLADFVIECLRIDRKKKITITKPKRASTNPITGITYYPYPVYLIESKPIKIKRLKTKLPNKYLTTAYQDYSIQRKKELAKRSYDQIIIDEQKEIDRQKQKERQKINIDSLAEEIVNEYKKIGKEKITVAEALAQPHMSQNKALVLRLKVNKLLSE